MKYGNQEFPILYHGTTYYTLVEILRTEKLSPQAITHQENLRKRSFFAKFGYEHIMSFMNNPNALRPLTIPMGGEKTIKEIIDAEGITITEENFESLRPQLIELEIKEGMHGINTSSEKDRYEHIWFTHEKRIAKSYAPNGIILGIEIPKSIEEHAYFRFYGQIGFPQSIGLEQLREVILWNTNRAELIKLQERFEKWNPKFREYK